MDQCALYKDPTLSCGTAYGTTMSAAELSRNQNVSEVVASAIAKLKKGLLTGSHQMEASGYRELHNAGAEAVAPLLSDLQRIELKEIGRVESTALLAGLATILHDISEDDSLKFIDAALSAQCHPVNKAVLQTIARFSRSHFRVVSIAGIEILEARDIDERYQATSYVSRWLANVPDDDLFGISRIYIIDTDQEQDFLGRYLPKTAVITIAWLTMVHPNIPIQWIYRLDHENTLYHEIGHHRYGHKGGQIPEQEAEADRYSKQLIRQAHPWLRKTMVALGWLFRNKKPELGSHIDVRSGSGTNVK